MVRMGNAGRFSIASYNIVYTLFDRKDVKKMRIHVGPGRCLF